jgi:hypothetical protein
MDLKLSNDSAIKRLPIIGLLIGAIAALWTVQRRSKPSRERRSVMELEGLGKEVWSDGSSEEYLKKERGSWD